MSARLSLQNAVRPLVLLFGLSAGAASADNALRPICYEGADNLQSVKLVMQQEGKLPVIGGNLNALNKQARTGQLFLVAQDGDGYFISSDKPIGQSAKDKMCITAAFQDAHFNSPSNDKPPAWTKFIKPSSDGPNVETAYANGGRIIFGAQAYSVGADGSRIPGNYLIAMTAPDRADKMGSVWFVEPSGKVVDTMPLVDAGPTPFMNHYLQNPPVSPQVK